MFIIKEIFIPHSNGGVLTPVTIRGLKNTFETTINKALFAFPYNPDKYQFVIRIEEAVGEGGFLLIVDPHLLPVEGQLFVSIVNDIPVVKNFISKAHESLKSLGTIIQSCHDSSINIH